MGRLRWLDVKFGRLSMAKVKRSIGCDSALHEPVNYLRTINTFIAHVSSSILKALVHFLTDCHSAQDI